MADLSTQPATGDYRVRLDDFQGPLDLLLHLIRRAELDPAEFPPEAVGWNADFELWTSIAIAPEDEPPAR